MKWKRRKTSIYFHCEIQTFNSNTIHPMNTFNYIKHLTFILVPEIQRYNSAIQTEQTNRPKSILLMYILMIMTRWILSLPILKIPGSSGTQMAVWKRSEWRFSPYPLSPIYLDLSRLYLSLIGTLCITMHSSFCNLDCNSVFMHCRATNTIQ